MEGYLQDQAMSEEQLAALIATLKDNAALRDKLQAAADLDATVALAKEAGFDVSKADWLKYQTQQTQELSDEELEGMAGGGGVCEGTHYINNQSATNWSCCHESGTVKCRGSNC
jgi:predicted ribosomally synthesized peptide with nif11-like leader